MSELAANESGADLSGKMLGGYELLRRIGCGGMADVYLAEQKSLGRRVALKILHARLASNPQYVQRFQNEARAAASLVHPNIVQIYEVGAADGVHYIAQEFVAGKSLDQVLQRQGTLQPGTVLEILRQVVSALCRAAELGIVHRDIKPANILYSPDGTVKVADFGLARIQTSDSQTLTQVGVALGTPLYMSPEQIEGRPVDSRSDIYSLGVSTYHLLTGQPPHAGETPLAIALQHVNADPAPLNTVCPGLSEDFARLVHHMLAKRPADRFASPSELLQQLKQLSVAAVEEGWAAGPDQWSLVDWIAADNSHNAARAELGSILRQLKDLSRPRASRSVRFALLAGAVAIGVAAGIATRPQFLLQARPVAKIPKRDSPSAQLFHAKMAESAEAWRAVAEYFPDADDYLKQLAQQGLVRHYLLVEPNYPQALQLAEQLAEQSLGNESHQAFALAAQCVSLEHLGDHHRASEVYSQLTPPMNDYLRRYETQLNDLLKSSLSRLGEIPRS